MLYNAAVVFTIVIAFTFMDLFQACSNIIVSPGASSDQSSIVAYNADSVTLYGSLYHYPAAIHNPDEKREIYDWDSGKYLGQIDQSPVTFNVVGNINEFGLIIGETTFGGISGLQSQSAAKIDYGSLIWVTLQRSRNARDAIKTISDLMRINGYASGGESFSIADPHEAWVMEIIGKGEYELGAVWVALKLPNGAVCAHANQARITKFPRDDPSTCLFAEDTISFAKKIGIYEGDDDDFSFSDVYDPVSFGGARFCEARVWSFFGSLMGEQWADQYLNYVSGANLTNRMPLFVIPPAGMKISAKMTMQYMRSHFESTALDMTGQSFADIGAADDLTPFRTHPLTWSSNIDPATGLSSSATHCYLHERPIATPQTGWNFVAQSRKWMPTKLAGLLWFGVDDSSTTVRFPIYGSATRVPQSFAGQGAQDGVTPPVMKFSMQNAFSVFNLVANWAYTRWNLIYPDISAEIDRKEEEYLKEVQQLDIFAAKIAAEKGEDAAVEYVTEYSVKAGNQLVRDWGDFFGSLFVKYRDGYVVTENIANPSCGCAPSSPGYPQNWYDRIASETKAHYLCDDPVDQAVRGPAAKNKKKELQPISKVQLLARK